MSKFQTTYPFERRRDQAIKIREKFPDKVPIIIENAAKSTLPELDKNKYLTPKDITVGEFISIIRGKYNLPPARAIFIFVNNTFLPASTHLISQIDEQYRAKDLFLYFIVSDENTYGNFIF